VRKEIVILILGIFILASTPSLTVHAAPTLLASSDPHTPPLYTQRDKQVSLSGSGYSASPYYVWVKEPVANSSHYSGVSFTPLASSQIPPGVGLQISANVTLGTYLVSVSTSSANDNSQAQAHFGIWGTLKPLYQRSEIARIVGGGLFPGVSSKLSIRNPAGDYVQTASIASGIDGGFNYTWRIPEDALTETYKVIIDGTGTFDNPQEDYVSEYRFSVTQATLIVKIIQQPNLSYQRTETAKITMGLCYPDGSPVAKTQLDTRPLILTQNQSTVAANSMSLTDASNGIWIGEIKLLANATLSTRYRFELPAMAFDDGYGNKGGAVTTVSEYFQVSNASLLISSEVNGTQIQIPFGQVSIISRVTYPDGRPLTNGTVIVHVNTGTSSSDIRLNYDSELSAWRGTYASDFGDLWRVGTWRVTVEAVDLYGNSGNATYDVGAQPYLLIVIVVLLIGLALFGRWTVSKYGRKIYFRTRKLIQKLRAMSTGRRRP
jgi:hypothetical protein